MCEASPNKAVTTAASSVNARPRQSHVTRKEMRAAAYEKLMEAMKLLASAGLPLLAEEVEELAFQVDLQATDSGR